MRKHLFRISITLVILVISAPFLFIGLLQVTDYRPRKIEQLTKDQIFDTLPLGSPFTLVTWNIGYAGLGDNMDFFYDGGTEVRTTSFRTHQNLDSIQKWLNAQNAHFVVLQEVDICSKRSYYIDQFHRIKNKLEDLKYGVFAYNYKVRYIPFPLNQPLGRVESGLALYSKLQPTESKRHAYTAQYALPKYLWMLDRAFLESSFHLWNDKKLHVINTHNTAFDDGEIRSSETKQLAEYVIKLYQEGNYVIIAGDWNQTPYDTSSYQTEFFNALPLKKEFFPSDWNIAWDSQNPTNRSLHTKKREEWVLHTIDFVIASPNVKIESVETINLHFTHSDHNPVRIIFSLSK